MFEQLVSIYAELTIEDFFPDTGSILLADDGDGIQYIAAWNYEKPIPEGFKLGK